MNISDDKKEDFDDNINFYVLYLLGGNAVYEILLVSGERTSFINDISQSPSRESSLQILYFMGPEKFFTNVMISDFYIMTNLYTIRPTIVKSIQVKAIEQKRISDTDLNNNLITWSFHR